jgi:hypothetical protein
MKSGDVIADEYVVILDFSFSLFPGFPWKLDPMSVLINSKQLKKLVS